jgi:hypothetical protein
MKTGKLTKQAAEWLQDNPVLAGALKGASDALFKGPSQAEKEDAYRIYQKRTGGLRSEMTNEDLNKYLKIARFYRRGI